MFDVAPLRKVRKARLSGGTAFERTVFGYDYVVVCLTAGKLLAETTEGNVETPLRAGQAYARPVGVEHNIVNASEGEFAFVEVELK